MLAHMALWGGPPTEDLNGICGLWAVCYLVTALTQQLPRAGVQSTTLTTLGLTHPHLCQQRLSQSAALSMCGVEPTLLSAAAGKGQEWFSCSYDLRACSPTCLSNRGAGGEGISLPPMLIYTR